MPVGRPGAMRRDARRNRDAIVRAAAELFTTAPPDVPLIEIARRAGVGQATLYRHFPDRASLAMAICEEAFRTLDGLAARTDPADRFELLFDAVVRCQATNRTLLTLLLGGPDGRHQARQLTRRITTLFAGPLREAQRAGRVRADLTPSDVMLAFTMIESLLRETPDPQRRRALGSRAVDLLRAGLAPPAG